MGQQKKWYLVSYDIRDPKRLARTARCIGGYGSRIQYSVFRCRLTVRQLERLQWELTPILTSEDDLLIIGLCSRCASQVRKKGNAEGWDVKTVTFEVV
ncbi:CRISPR-associated endonuclease Cas2 [Candidatus Bipolaricaulota bacterium]|nr:CRISPR-associated endonuclease Cas2 [Candidatus Bipolaricaulota bacterium]